jgi:alpha-glucosidase (family GH31 glycosyl hydrolase)
MMWADFIGSNWRELLTRWLQAGVLNPCTATTTMLATLDQEPWVHGEPYTLWNRRTIQWRYELMPFLYSLAYQAATSGVPMNVPVAFPLYGDSNTWSQNEYDFLVGRDLLAAPVVSSSAVTRAVYLPAGLDWYFAGIRRPVQRGAERGGKSLAGQAAVLSAGGRHICPRGRSWSMPMKHPPAIWMFTSGRAPTTPFHVV